MGSQFSLGDPDAQGREENGRCVTVGGVLSTKSRLRYGCPWRARAIGRKEGPWEKPPRAQYSRGL